LETNNKILIVDDIPINIQMAMNILKDEGYKMYYAKSGEMALKLIDENDFGLILLDIMMPEMNGFEVCLKLKSNDKTKNIPIIFLSGKDSSTDIEEAYAVGGIDYVVKPFITIELITKVKSYTRLKQLEDRFKELED
jgi:putative two-component system response regulator